MKLAEAMVNSVLALERRLPGNAGHSPGHNHFSNQTYSEQYKQQLKQKKTLPQRADIAGVSINILD